MSAQFSDPLEGLETRPIESQVAVMANELRHQRNQLAEVKRKLDSVQVAMWGVVLALLAVAGAVVVAAVAQ